VILDAEFVVIVVVVEVSLLLTDEVTKAWPNVVEGEVVMEDCVDAGENSCVEAAVFVEESVMRLADEVDDSFVVVDVIVGELVKELIGDVDNASVGVIVVFTDSIEVLAGDVGNTVVECADVVVVINEDVEVDVVDIVGCVGIRIIWLEHLVLQKSVSQHVGQPLALVATHC